MDPSAIAAAPEPAGFVAWIMANGQLIAFFAQIIYWFGMLLLIGYAVWQYKKWVNFQMGVGKSGQLRTGETADKKDVAEKPSVDKFVE